MRQRIFALLLTGLLAWGLAACNDTQRQTAADDATPSQTAGTALDGSSREDGDQSENDVAAAIERTVLVDQEGIVITAQELTDDAVWGTGIKLLLENHSEEDQIIQCDYAVVNNFMMTSLLFSAEVNAGKQANETLYFSDTVLEGAGITTITEMSFVFYTLDSETYQRGFTTEEVALSTTADGSYEQPLPDDGMELYNENGIRIVGRYVEENTLWGAGVVLFVENTGDEDLVLSCESLSINGFMITPLYAQRINGGRVALSSITVLSSDLEENGIQTVEDVEMVFKGLDPESYQTLFETETLQFSAA